MLWIVLLKRKRSKMSLSVKYKAKLLINKGVALYIGSSSQTVFHKHYVLQLAILVRGDYQVYIGDNIHINRSIYINSEVRHKHSCENGIHFSLFIEPMSNLGKCLREKYPSNYVLLDVDLNSVKGFYQQICNNEVGIKEMEEWIVKVFALKPNAKKTDPRITKLIEQIEDFEHENKNVSDLLSNIHLSESRIRHLFKEHTGISIKRYCLWAKVRKALYYITQGENLSQAAYHAEFSDYPHLSRTIKKMFGLNLKTLLQDSHSVQEI